MGEDVVRHGSRTRRTGRGGRMSRWLLVAMALPTSLVGASVAGGAAPAPVAPPHIAAVIQAIEQSASQGGVNLEGKAWQLTQGNALSDAPSGNWLLQTPNCWGDPQCSPAQGQTHFLQALTQEISTAQTLVDITGLLPFADGGFEQAIASGLAATYQAGNDPLVRVLDGVSPGSDPSGGAPGVYLKTLLDDVAKDMGGKGPADPRIAVGDFKSSTAVSTASWNHSKIVDVDGKEAIVGGVNFYSSDYLQTNNPVTDTSMQVSGPAALASTKFADQLWGFTCNNIGVVYASWAHTAPVATCPSAAAPLVAGAATYQPGTTTILALGRMGQGIVSSTAA